MKLVCQIWLGLLASGVAVIGGLLVYEKPNVLWIPAGFATLYFTVYAINTLLEGKTSATGTSDDL